MKKVAAPKQTTFGVLFIGNGDGAEGGSAELVHVSRTATTVADPVVEEQPSQKAELSFHQLICTPVRLKGWDSR